MHSIYNHIDSQAYILEKETKKNTRFGKRKEKEKMSLYSPSMKSRTNLTLEEKKPGSLLSWKISHTSLWGKRNKKRMSLAL